MHAQAMNGVPSAVAGNLLCSQWLHCQSGKWNVSAMALLPTLGVIGSKLGILEVTGNNIIISISRAKLCVQHNQC